MSSLHLFILEMQVSKNKTHYTLCKKNLLYLTRCVQDICNADSHVF